jgi:glycosyltransferase involved in cell wall biosynthesis
VRIVFLAETYPRQMSYMGTMLPKFTAQLGAEVHLVALDLPPYHYAPAVAGMYATIAAGAGSACGAAEEIDGYHVHLLAHRRLIGLVAARGLARKLAELRPDVVYSFSAIGWLPLQALAYRLRSGARLFTGSHTTASTFPLAARAYPWLTAGGVRCFLMRWLPGRLISLFTEKCYSPTADSAEVAIRFFGVQSAKMKVVHLGVDLEVFHPLTTAAEGRQRRDLRERLGFDVDDVVCICTGKMTAEKHVLLLAEAIERLRQQGRKFRGLFIGAGPLHAAVAAKPHSTVLALMPFTALAEYYRAADLGVWPGTESTSMLDAAACALPLVVSDRIYREHVDGNGRTYRAGQLDDLVEVLAGLGDANLRRQLGTAGSRKMQLSFNWETIAAGRLADFGAALYSSSGTATRRPSRAD